MVDVKGAVAVWNDAVHASLLKQQEQQQQQKERVGGHGPSPPSVSAVRDSPSSSRSFERKISAQNSFHSTPLPSAPFSSTSRAAEAHPPPRAVTPSSVSEEDCEEKEEMIEGSPAENDQKRRAAEAEAEVAERLPAQDVRQAEKVPQPAPPCVERKQQSSQCPPLNTNNSGGWRTTSEYLPSSCSSSSDDEGSCGIFSDEEDERGDEAVGSSGEVVSFYCDDSLQAAACDDDVEYVDYYTGHERSQPCHLLDDGVRLTLLGTSSLPGPPLPMTPPPISAVPAHLPADARPTTASVPRAAASTAAREIEVCPADLQRRMLARHPADSPSRLPSPGPALGPSPTPAAPATAQQPPPTSVSKASYASELDDDEYDTDNESGDSEEDSGSSDEDYDSSCDSSTGSSYLDLDLNPENGFGYLTPENNKEIHLSGLTGLPGAALPVHSRPSAPVSAAPRETRAPSPAVPGPPVIGTGSRIPVELQAVFLASQQGVVVDKPPSSGVASRVFGSWFGGGRKHRSQRNLAKGGAGVSQKIVRFFRIPHRASKKALHHPPDVSATSSLAGVSQTSAAHASEASGIPSSSSRRPSNSSVGGVLRSFSVRSLGSRRSHGSSGRGDTDNSGSKASTTRGDVDASASQGSRGRSSVGSRYSRSSGLTSHASSSRRTQGSRQSRGSRQTRGSQRRGQLHETIFEEKGDNNAMALPSLHTYRDDELSSDEDSSHSWDSDISDLSSDDEELYADIEQVLANAKQACGFNGPTPTTMLQLQPAAKPVEATPTADQLPLVLELSRPPMQPKSVSFKLKVPPFGSMATEPGRAAVTLEQGPPGSFASSGKASFEPTIPVFGTKPSSPLQAQSVEPPGSGNRTTPKSCPPAAPRIPLELQEIFLQSNRGENIEQIKPPSNGAAFKVFQRMWPRKPNSCRNLRSQVRKPEKHLSSRMLASFLMAKAPKVEKEDTGDPHGTDNSPVTSLDDSRSVDSSDDSSDDSSESSDSSASSSTSSLASTEMARPETKIGFASSAAAGAGDPKEIEFVPRIPLDLQAVFLASNRGEDVHEPPSSGAAFKVFESSRKSTGNRFFGVKRYKLSLLAKRNN